MIVTLVRHPAPDIASGLCYGRLDVGLTVQGEAGLEALADDLAARSAARLWTSPARRCTLLAEIVARRSRLVPQQDARLAEIDFGEWEGQPWSELPRPAMDRWAADPLGFAPPQGEAGSALLARVEAFWVALRAADENAIVISHGGPLRILTALAQGAPPDLLAPSPAWGSITALAC